MSERTHAPRSGGRTAEQGMTGLGRDADTRRSDARGARHFTTGDDTRRSGIGRDGGVGGTRRTTEPESVSDEGRRQPPARGVGRRPEPAIGRGRRPQPAESGDRPTGPVPARGRATGDVRGPVAGEVRSRATGEVRGAATGEVRSRATGDARGRATDEARVRATGEVSERGTARPTPLAERDSATGRGKTASAFGKRGRVDGGRGRRPVTDAPVDGTAALDIKVAAAEPARMTGEVGNGPRLRVAPPAPINAPRAPFVATVIALVVVGVLGILLINTKTNENSFRIADLKNQDAVLDNQQQDLKNQLVEVSSIGNLDAAARRLGLVKAENPALILMPDGSFIGVLTPANGRPAVTAPDAKKETEPTVEKDGTTPTGAGQAVGGTTPTGAGQAVDGTTPTGAGQAVDGTTPTGAGQAVDGTVPAGTGQ